MQHYVGPTYNTIHEMSVHVALSQQRRKGVRQQHVDTNISVSRWDTSTMDSSICYFLHFLQ